MPAGSDRLAAAAGRRDRAAQDRREAEQGGQHGGEHDGPGVDACARGADDIGRPGGKDRDLDGRRRDGDDGGLSTLGNGRLLPGEQAAGGGQDADRRHGEAPPTEVA